MPAEPRLARLARLAVLHFLKHHGVGAATARKGARSVQERCAAWMRALPGGGRGSLTIALSCGARSCEVAGTPGRSGPRQSLFRCPRPARP